ncbi:phosphorylase, partial [Haematococcus lacustris]
MSSLMLPVLALAFAAITSASVTIAPIARVDVGLFSAYNAEYNTQILQLTGYKVNYTVGGRVYTTMTAQAMALLFQPKYMLLSGIAGGIDPDLRIGDVVIPRTWFNPQLQKFIRPLHDENDNLTNYFADSGLDFPDKFYTEPGKTPGDFAMTLPSPATCQLPAPSAALLANVTANPALTVSSGFAVPIEVELLVNKSDTFKTPTPPTAFHLPVSSTILATAARVLRNITLENNAGYASLPYIPTARITQRGMSSNSIRSRWVWLVMLGVFLICIPVIPSKWS